MILTTCLACSCSTATLLGTLGTTAHFRCRNCGWTFSATVDFCDECGEVVSDSDDLDEDGFCHDCADRFERLAERERADAMEADRAAADEYYAGLRRQGL